MSFAQLPYEVLEPILLEAVEPGSHAGAQLLLVCGLWHAIGRRRLYERVEVRLRRRRLVLSGQEADP